MKLQYPISYTLEDGTNVKVDRMEEDKNYTFILDKPTGQTDSFTTALQTSTEPGQQPSMPTDEDSQRKEAIELFLKLQRYE